MADPMAGTSKKADDDGHGNNETKTDSREAPPTAIHEVVTICSRFSSLCLWLTADVQ
jgi:hypothetical protein